MLRSTLSARGLLRRPPPAPTAALAKEATRRESKHYPVARPRSAGQVKVAPPPSSSPSHVGSAPHALHEWMPRLSHESASLFLHQSLASRDPHAIVAAVAATLARAPRSMTRLVAGHPADEVEVVATLLAACVGVSLRAEDCEGSPYLLPPWVASRLLGGVTSARRTQASSSSDTASVAFATFCELCRQLQASRVRSGGSRERESRGDTEQALHVFSLLCAVAVAPSERTAIALSQQLLRKDSVFGGSTDSYSAVGCALASYCQRRAQCGGGGEGAESMWLRLWASLGVPSSSSSSAETAGEVGGSPCSSALSCLVPRRLVRQQCVGWHLHCLLRTQRTPEATAQLQRAFAVDQETALALPESSLAELLTLLPMPTADGQQHHPLQHDDGGPYTRLADVLLSRLRLLSGSGTASPFASPIPSQLLHHSHVPAVTKNAALFSRMVDFVVDGLLAAPNPSTHARRLADLHLLFTIANVDALAASLVPAGQPLTTVMVAQTSEERKRKARLLGKAMCKAVEYLCREKADPHGRAAPCRESAVDKVEEEEEAALGSAVRVLRSLLAHCASREKTLPARRAEPRWRRELLAKTAVRTHKYQLLLSELPHVELSAVLTHLLGQGHLAEGSALGSCLVQDQLVDLRFYSLYVLGSLYQALGTPDPASSATPAEPSDATEAVRATVRSLYRRREEVFGEQLYLLPASSDDEAPLPSTTAASPSAPQVVRSSTRAPVRVPPLSSLPALREAAALSVKDGGAALDAIRLVKCLMNRTVVAPGGKLVMEGQPQPFDTWVMKGKVSLQL